MSTFVIEHMEEGFSDWVKLEYAAIASDVGSDKFYLSSLPKGTELPEILIKAEVQGTETEITKFETVIPSFDKSRVCLLDPSAEETLSPEDGDKFDIFLFGGILGDHPPRDRTGELRKYGFAGRNLDKFQMTTDTAVRVTKKVVDDKIPIDKIPYVDYPELKFSKYESTEMPFRYVTDAEGKPIMPKGMFELIKMDSEKSLDDML
ncbi:SAM-dependent RNA methyltransferase [Yarrowia lipolytica]|uniref:YALI0B18546p n=2 Tax=Yarrowia lipolytica TaxID=4952 RepID=Q6CE50_YARLI|nr:YALI0B18546p [Yarrowia lipolytica CLIB122]AOW01894.1 hypothetical protein YALI1_B24051g [Yarrowia lipolytica]KAB8280730.1 SAM-dependent RNA methyltransferase [Yarrowia lipolytica]KAE8169831.1 SAM-dependent RNA methyltransferase [Yarrowia lipolytica]KAJ8052678.1 SAM-dependent RNA methyltransferase [Yarrowia lipolytica]QNP96855.1 Protein arginine N-methyltransferase SFM1 [Yarrowia lipolytica]|eukprot:XP_501062.1 YALI0B18546p [Yarrowia lipolytica CLIB122]